MQQLKLDKLKLELPLSVVKEENENVCSITATKDSSTFKLHYTQKTPYYLQIIVDDVEKTLTIEFTGKILGKDYPKLITRETIRECFEVINSVGAITLDIDKALKYAKVLLADITCDCEIGDIKEFVTYINGNLKSNRMYNSRVLKNGNYILEKNVTSDRSKLRLTIYDKDKELHHSNNNAFNTYTHNELLEAFKGKTRFEMNIKSQEQLKKVLHITNTSLWSVLNSEVTPIRAFLDDVIAADDDMPILKEMRTYQQMLVLKECGYDIKQVENKIREHYNHPNVSKLIKPYRALLNERHNLPSEKAFKQQLLSKVEG